MHTAILANYIANISFHFMIQEDSFALYQQYLRLMGKKHAHSKAKCSYGVPNSNPVARKSFTFPCVLFLLLNVKKILATGFEFGMP